MSVLKLTFFLFFFSTPVFSVETSWREYEVPGTYCGSGTPYKFYYKGPAHGKSERKLAVQFKSGGACWSKSTCYGPNLRAWIYSPSAPPKDHFMMREDSPVKDFTHLYFPYCTGDVFSGKHVYDATEDKKLYHFGYSNITKIWRYLKKHQLVQFEELEDVVLYGSSAGGIGSFIHTETIDPYLNEGTNKYVLSDSPGLHFGEEFWDKFTERQIKDFYDAFYPIGLRFSENSGLLSPYMPEVCHTMSDWEIGIIQGSQDIVMSLVFGDISHKLHERLVLGPLGIKQQVTAASNCHAFVPRSKMHQFLSFDFAMERIRDGQHRNAKSFVINLFSRRK